MSGSRIKHELVIVALVEPAPLGDIFSQWPLHITVMPWFEVTDIGSAKKLINQRLQAWQPFMVAAGERAYFGVRRLPVLEVADDELKLKKLHNDLLELVHQQSWPLRGRYVGDNYRPHITQQAGRDAQGKIQISQLHLVESQAQGYRKVVAKFQLGKGAISGEKAT